MNQLLKDALDQNLGLAQMDVTAMAADIGYLPLRNINTAGQLSTALQKHGPIAVVGGGLAQEMFVNGIHGSQVQLFDLGRQELVTQPANQFLREHGDRLYAAPLMGNENKGNFSELLAVRDGVGNYHGNHFVAYFHASGVTQQQIDQQMRDFLPRFVHIFNMDNIASVERSRLTYKQDVVLRFAVNAMQGLIHDDHVYLRRGKGNSFYASTLKRNWRYLFEEASFIGIDPLNWFPSPDDLGYAINSRHFLAGRRSWTYGHVQDDVYFIETAAIERYSHTVYQILADVPVVGIPHNTVVDIWNHLLNNALTYYNQTAVDGGSLVTGYERASFSRGDIFYREYDEPDLQTILSDDTFQAVLDRHPHLSP